MEKQINSIWLLAFYALNTLQLAIRVEVKLYLWRFVSLAKKHSYVSSKLFIFDFFIAQSSLLIIMTWKNCKVEILFELLQLRFMDKCAIIKLLSFLVCL